jgi:DNA-binding NtrC family response regulator
MTETRTPLDALLGASAAARTVREFARRASAVSAPVLLMGESGTGKGLVARVIHALSARSRAPLVSINCAGVPETLFESEFFGHARGAFTGAQQAHRGLLEQAHGGTLFLDEIGELAPALQAKLLSVLEDGEVRRVGGERLVRVDVRIVAATNLDLDAAVAEGRFRRDLFHRLVVLAFRLPPLRERGDDIELLLQHYVAVYAARYGRPARSFDEAAWNRLRLHAWPGNIRQLAHAVESAVLLCDDSCIRLQHLPCLLLDVQGNGALHSSDVTTATAAGRRYSFYGSPAEERRRIEEALRRWRGNKTHAARELGMARNTLRAKVREFRIADVEPEGDENGARDAWSPGS